MRAYSHSRSQSISLGWWCQPYCQHFISTRSLYRRPAFQPVAMANQTIARKPLPNRSTAAIISLPIRHRSTNCLSARVCCHCRSPIYLEEQHKVCLFCDVSFCSACAAAGLHSNSHRQDEINVRHRQISPTSGLERSASCNRCGDPWRGGYACRCCDFHICNGCSGWAKSNLKGHEHREFESWILVLLDKSSKDWLTSTPESCNHPIGLHGHCDVCLNGMCRCPY